MNSAVLINPITIHNDNQNMILAQTNKLAANPLLINIQTSPTTVCLQPLCLNKQNFVPSKEIQNNVIRLQINLPSFESVSLQFPDEKTVVLNSSAGQITVNAAQQNLPVQQFTTVNNSLQQLIPVNASYAWNYPQTSTPITAQIVPTVQSQFVQQQPQFVQQQPQFVQQQPQFVQQQPPFLQQQPQFVQQQPQFVQQQPQNYTVINTPGGSTFNSNSLQQLEPTHVVVPIANVLGVNNKMFQKIFLKTRKRESNSSGKKNHSPQHRNTINQPHRSANTRFSTTKKLVKIS